MTTLQKIYSDIDFTFLPKPVVKDIALSYDTQAIIRSIRNLLLTNYYERPFQPEIGSNVRRLLFENLDVITATTIKNEIERTIQNYEPRVTVKNINVTADFDNNGFKVYLEFFIVNQTAPITINFLLERIR